MSRNEPGDPASRAAASLAGFSPHDGTIGSMLRSRAAAQPDREAIVFENVSLTWHEVQDRVERLASFLEGQGVVSGSRIAVVASNSAGFVLAFFAIAELSAVMVTINGELGPALIAETVARAEPSLLLISPDRLGAVADVPEGLKAFSLEGDCPRGASLSAEAAASPRRPRSPATPNACCLIMFTSGTTGRPKGVMHSQASFALAGEGFVGRMALDRTDRVLCVLPLFHINALFYSVGGALAAGATLVLARRFSASMFWPTVLETGATQVNLIAAAGMILARRDRSEFRPGHGLAKVYLSPLAREVHDCFRDEFGVPVIREGYGMTEVRGVINQPVEEPPLFGAMGRISRHPLDGRPLAELRLVGSDGFVVEGIGEGELQVRTPMVMQGYFRDTEQTAAAFRDDWFRTGDLVRRGANGRDYYFVERIKDIIRRRGENISGAELDRLIGAYPEIAQVAVIPTKADLGEDEILAVVVPRGPSFSAEDFAVWCRQNLPRLKAPRFLTVVDDLPRTPSEKIEKYKLKRDPAIHAAAIDLDLLKSAP